MKSDEGSRPDMGLIVSLQSANGRLRLIVDDATRTGDAEWNPTAVFASREYPEGDPCETLTELDYANIGAAIVARLRDRSRTH